MKNGKVTKKIVLPWVKELEIFDRSINADYIGDYSEVLFGETRVLSKRQKALKR